MRRISGYIFALICALQLSTSAAEDKPGLLSYFSLWTGAKVDNPYRIGIDTNLNKAFLEKNDSSTDGYIELKLRYRFVDRLAAGEPDFGFRGSDDPANPDEGKNGEFINPLTHFPDLDTAIGYVFRGSDAPNTLTTSTVAGGSDIYAVGSLGFPWWRRIGDDKSRMKAIQSTIEIGGGFVTDKNSLHLHPTLFAGGGFQFYYTRKHGDGDQAVDLPGFWTGRIGYARIDRPNFVKGSKEVLLNEFGDPSFRAKWAPSMGFDVTVPISSSISAQFGGNVYFTDSPASWNITVGLALDIDNTLKALSK